MAHLAPDNSDSVRDTAALSAISRRPMLDYFHIPRVRNRFWRFFSSREKMVEGIKTLAWVIPLTLLIWIYAEREQVVTPNISNVVVNVRSNDATRYVETAGPEKPRISLQLSGPQQALERVRESLGLNGLTIDLGSSMGTGRGQSVNIVNSIQNQELFKSNGVTVQEAQPPQVSVDVDRIARLELPVLVPANITNLSPESRFEPAKVTVSGPSSLLTDVKVYAKLDGYDQLKKPGAHVIAGVPLVLSPALPADKVHLLPSQITANVTVLANDVSYLIPYAIPIWVDTPPTTFKNYDLSLTNGDSIANVTVIGSKQGIDAIKDGSFIVKARLEVDPTTDSGKDMSKALKYELPEGVKVDPGTAARTVDFHLTLR